MARYSSLLTALALPALLLWGTSARQAKHAREPGARVRNEAYGPLEEVQTRVSDAFSIPSPREPRAPAEATRAQRAKSGRVLLPDGTSAAGLALVASLGLEGLPLPSHERVELDESGGFVLRNLQVESVTLAPESEALRAASITRLQDSPALVEFELDAYGLDIQVLQPDGEPGRRSRVAVLRDPEGDELLPTGWHVEQAPYTDEHGHCRIYCADASLLRLEVQQAGLWGSVEVSWSFGQRLRGVTVQLSPPAGRAGLTPEVVDESGVPLDGYQLRILARGDSEAIRVLHSEDIDAGSTIWDLPEGEFELRLVARTTGAPELYDLSQEPLTVSLVEGASRRARMQVHAGGRLRVSIARRSRLWPTDSPRAYLEVRRQEDPSWSDMGSLTYGEHMVSDLAFPLDVSCYADLLFEEGWYLVRIKGAPGSERSFFARAGRIVELEY